MMGYNGTMGSGLAMLLMVGAMLLVIAGAVLLIMWIVRGLNAGGEVSNFATADSAHSSTQETPMTILQRRYASGEIGADEYERVQADLRRDGNLTTNETINMETK